MQIRDKLNQTKDSSDSDEGINDRDEMIYPSEENRNHLGMGKLRNLDISMDGERIISPTVIASGGTKTVINIGNGNVIALVQHGRELPTVIIEAEVNLSKKLRSLGLRTQEYERANADINGISNIPVLKMPGFESMSLNGKQVRDRKNYQSSCGESTIFGDQQNLKSVDHWRKIFQHIQDEMVIYLINNLNFSYDSFNLLIEDAERTAEIKQKHPHTLFSELGQEIHLYLFDFNDHDMLYQEDKYYEFTDMDGAILDGNIADIVNKLFDMIIDTIFHGVKDEEYKMVMNTRTISNGAIIKLKEQSDIALQTLRGEIVLKVVASIKEHLEMLTPNDRVEKYATNHMKRRHQMKIESQLRAQKQEEKWRIEREKWENERAISEQKWKIWEEEQRIRDEKFRAEMERISAAEKERIRAIDEQFNNAKNKRSEPGTAEASYKKCSIM